MIFVTLSTVRQNILQWPQAFYLHQEQNDPVANLSVHAEQDPMISFVVNGMPIQVDPALDLDSLALIIRSCMAS